MKKKKNLYLICDFSKNNILFDLNIGVNIAVMKCDKAFICLQRGWFWMSWKTEHFMVLTKNDHSSAIASWTCQCCRT